ncbi:hypothetical protein [Daejeonella sp.]|uniref:hypothetical protein n=1 Tax=Daejeonella sp. TaxID=2805397 RepID=UPI0030BF3653
MKDIFVGSILACIVLLNSGCPKSCIEANYSFSVNAQVGPDRDSINVGDTIYITSSFPAKLIDQGTGAEINYTGAKKIGSTLGVGKLKLGSAIPVDAVFDFSYISIKGNVYNDRGIASPDAVQQLIYQDSNNTYELKVGLIAKVKGTYALGIGNGLSVGRSGVKNCEKAAFDISLNKTNQHFNIYQSFTQNNQSNDYERKHAYYFVVK